MRKAFSPKLRKQILERDGHRCLVCHAVEDLQIDHCLPVCLGGNNNPLNLRVLCGKCNASRNRDIKRYRTKRIRQHLDDIRRKQALTTEALRLTLQHQQDEIGLLKWNTEVWESLFKSARNDQVRYMEIVKSGALKTL